MKCIVDGCQAERGRTGPRRAGDGDSGTLLCPEHDAEWDRSGEYRRMSIDQAANGFPRAEVAFMDFVNRMAAERRNHR